MLTRDDLRETASDIKEFVGVKVDAVEDRMAKVEAHLRQLNGSVARHQREIGVLEGKISTLQSLPESVEFEETGDNKAVVTVKQAKILAASMLAGLTAIGAIGIELLRRWFLAQ